MKHSAWLAIPVLILLLQGCHGAGIQQPVTEVPLGTTPLPDPTETPTSVPVTATSSGPQQGGNADVLHVRAVQSADGSWTFFVTVAHPDTGWEDYADGWDLVTLDGVVLKPDPDGAFTRTLAHPHEDEQPFTRSQADIRIPAGVTQVRVRAHDLVDGFGGREVIVDLTTSAGPDFEVERP